MKRPALGGMLRCTATMLVMFSWSSTPILQAGPVTSTNWSRDFLEDLPEDARFALATVMSLNGRLFGFCSFTNNSEETVVLEGRRTPDREFCPSVEAQVGDNRNGPWITCVQPKRAGEATVLRVDPTSSAKLVVDLEVFRPYIEKTKYGRLVLNTGDVALFELDQLRPPKERGQ